MKDAEKILVGLVGAPTSGVAGFLLLNKLHGEMDYLRVRESKAETPHTYECPNRDRYQALPSPPQISVSESDLGD
jgi:hypothetical protein